MCIFATMLQKFRHITAVVLALLFLYPLVYQSIHVFEHTNETDCCDQCHIHHDAPEAEIPGTNTYTLGEEETQCPICSFHYAVLQLDEPGAISFHPEAFSEIICPCHQSPFVVFQGYSRSLRAPPSTNLS